MENNHNLAGKIAVLSGGGGDIGRALAVKLAQCGMRIVLVGGNNPEKLNATASAVKPYGSCIILPGDLTNPDFIKQTTTKITADFPQVDVLINNAGVAQSTPFEEITIEEFDNYTWKKDKKTGEYINEPVDMFNHHIDSIRYGTQNVMKQKVHTDEELAGYMFL